MVDEFLKNYIQRPFRPYFYLEDLVGSDRITEYFHKSISSSDNKMILEGGHAIASWHSANWDTLNTGYKTARINFLMANGPIKDQVRYCEKLYKEMEKTLSENGYEYLLFRVHTSDLPALQTAQNNGFQVMDGLITLKSQGEWIPDNKIGTKIRLARKSDMERAMQIARTSFIYDRFHTDPAIPDSVADELHGRWILDSFAINTDERVLIAEGKDGIQGFLSYSLNSALSDSLGIRIMTIILLATHEGTRNKGVAKAMIEEAMNIVRKESYKVVLVGTQLRNSHATRLYEILGFRMVDSSYTLRKLLKTEPI